MANLRSPTMNAGSFTETAVWQARGEGQNSAPLSHQWKGDNAPYLLLMGCVLGQVTQLCVYELCM